VAKRITKRDLILEEARQRVRLAEANVESARHELEIAKAIHLTERQGYERLQSQLAPQPRQSATKTNSGTARATRDSLKPSSKKRADVEPLCVNCSIPELHQIHLVWSERGYHRFVPPPAMTKPTRKSGTKRRAGLPQGDNAPQCAQELTNNGVCAFPEDHLIHSPEGGYSGYHPFVPPVRNAQAPSSMNGAGSSTIQNSEAATASAQVAAGGSSEQGN
jgi:hypothetical protein